MMKAKMVPDRVAICSVDPGVTTGVARGVFGTGDGTHVADVFRRGFEVESWEVDGPTTEQAWEIAAECRDWFGWCNINGVAIPHCFLVIERFELRQRHVDLAPVEIRSGLLALWHTAPWPAVEEQAASDAMTYATARRLREWGAWQKGSEHRRDAMRHLLLKLSRTM